MSTLTKPTSAAPTVPPHAVRAHLSFPHLVRSEWIKLWTVRSTYWILPLTVLAFVGISFLVAFFSTQDDAQANGAPPMDASFLLTPGVYFGQLAIVVLAVLTITGEYSTGMIRSTFAAAPARLPVLTAKLLVVLVVSFLTGAVATALTWLVTRPVLGDEHAIDLGSTETQRILLGAPLYLTAIALFAFALGALLRHSAAALATVLGLLLVIETVFSAIPTDFFRNTAPFLPGTAGQRLTASQQFMDMTAQMSDAPQLTPWQGFGVLLAWGVVILAAAAVLVRRRDA
ncbi:ABC transporter permease [Cellulomonas sp. 179-A 4D5 NHS]|uniref:ABC transporter permease subunit n=1 Tax=Cellulomonas sp. 179-A 4D5 NHS TaxID=3142378 RepID=UPI0039A01C3A